MARTRFVNSETWRENPKFGDAKEHGRPDEASALCKHVGAALKYVSSSSGANMATRMKVRRDVDTSDGSADAR